MKFLNGNTSHPSADQVYSALHKQFPTLSLATVYNTLEALKAQGVICEVGGDADKKRFDPATGSHHHLICMRCHEIVDVPEKYRPVLTEDEKQGFEVSCSRIEFFGLCPRCQSPDGQS